MTDPRLRVLPDRDYGEGKPPEQEAVDSAYMLGLLLLVMVVMVLGICVGLIIGFYVR